MPNDPYAVLRALVRAEAVRNAPKQPKPQPQPDEQQHKTRPQEHGRN
ncbi:MULTISPECIES: hypothetical protein [Streptomyces]|nr:MULTISPECIES: hypothetical protein [Streptomyces]